MDALFEIDGRAFSGIGVERLERSFRIPDGENAGSMLSHDYERDLFGTYYDYMLVLSTADMLANEYDALYAILSAPVNSHMVTMPYGMQTITFEAMILSGEDELIPIDDGIWWGNLQVEIRAKRPQRYVE